MGYWGESKKRKGVGRGWGSEGKIEKNRAIDKLSSMNELTRGERKKKTVVLGGGGAGANFYLHEMAPTQHFICTLAKLLHHRK